MRGFPEREETLVQIHVVQQGDTIWSLARQYGVSVNRIVTANGLENPSQLVIGMSLLIPVPYPKYVVQRGNTLSAIANLYGTTVSAILQANQLTNASTIYPGQTLRIPVVLHSVLPGESLWTIARNYGITPTLLASVNRISDVNSLRVGQRLRIPRDSGPTIDVNGFMTAFGSTGAAALRGVAYDLTSASPFGYRIQADGSLVPVDDAAIIQTAYNTGVVPMLTITNFTSTDPGTKVASTILNNATLQDTLLTNVIETLQNKGYQGINIDFENVSPADKTAYNRFLQRTVDRLHPAGFFVSSSLAPKTSANQPGLLYEAHDYPAHGRIMDFVVLMTYEWGYRLGPPQAISPLNQIRAVLDYAVSVIPPSKILMGFQVYARDWVLPHVQGQEAETFDVQEAIRRAIEYGADIQYDTLAQSPYYNYTDASGVQHQVWFEDARSAQAKLNLVKIYGLRGLSYWVIEYPFPQNWSLLADDFTIRKYNTR